MESIKKLGLAGKNISYSFSKKFFEAKFSALKTEDYSYTVYDLEEIGDVEKLFEDPQLLGFNVTTPYKEKIIGYLDELSAEASAIGAVNCVKIENGKKKGYNTDAFGFEKTLEKYRNGEHTSALILGDGGAAKAIKYVLSKNGISAETVSRKSPLNFENLTAEKVKNHKIIIQCTPVGTHPNVHDSVPFPFEGLTENHLVIDLVYNPEKSQFLIKSEENGATAVNGYYMLEQQAEKAWEIWTVPEK